MKKLHTCLLAMLSVLALTWSACTDSCNYDPAPNVEGEGVYFPSSTQTSITLNDTEGSFKLAVQRTQPVGDVDVVLNAKFTEGGENVFTVPSKVSFDDGKVDTVMVVSYQNLVRGTKYTITLSFADGTPYGRSEVTFNVLYPEPVLEEWEVISEEAVLVDNLFSMYGVSDYYIYDITVEKEKTTNKYRFKSPYNQAYANNVLGITFPADFEFPYIVLDGETYKNEAPDKYYIASTALGFKMTDGAGPSFDAEWNTFGSVAGNLKTGDGPIPPTSAQYPLGEYDKSVKKFDLGTLYHNLDGYGFFVFSGISLYLDPTLMSPDYDRDYTWAPLEDATGYFTSEIAGESWMQDVEQAEEDPTFFRFTSLYAKDVHIYFNYDAEKGILTMPSLQPTGMTTFGNTVYVEAVPGESTVDEENTFSFVLSFYLADKDGKKTAELMQATETFLWGRGPLDQLQKGKKIDDYVGTWAVPVTDGKQSGKIGVTITKADESTVLVQGLSVMEDYDDTMAMGYDAETGFLNFGFQQVASIGKYYGFVAPFNSATMQLGSKDGESLIAGLSSEGTLTFLNSPDNEGSYDSMVYVVTDGNGMMFMSGFWNWLEWTPVAPATGASFGSLSKVSFSAGSKTLEQGVAPKRTYKKDLQMKANPVQPLKKALKANNAAQGFSVVR
ncbi:hypothetical protein [uncultured Bacteroides sp.]|uniref:hypothetical protein n=1 Tax=uncultured Bacteroides sp. TaxID=162156 RepID=UPI0023D506A2|nr:hypothetical protein [uncultured Bacteroides sp.]MDE6172108.1 hypothetical protein [Bacteroides sp.]